MSLDWHGTGGKYTMLEKNTNIKSQRKANQ